MANQEFIEKKDIDEKSRIKSVIETWKKGKKEDEEYFKQQLKDPEYLAMIESLKGKVIINKNSSS